MKKLIPALCMLLVAASILGTSTYAWFSMNDTVEANGMSVNAVSEAIFLEITGADPEGNYDVTANAGMNQGLKPVAHTGTFANKSAVDNGTWYFKYVKSTDAQGRPVYSEQKNIQISADYVASTSFNVKVRDDDNYGGENAYDLYLSNVTINSGLGGLTVIIATETKCFEFTADNDGDFDVNADNILFDEVTSDPQTVYVYIYFDGNNADVITDNIENLVGSVTFKLNAFAEDKNPAQATE